MRIPTTLFSDTFLSYIQRISEKLFWNNQRIATQKQIHRPSDDPIGTSSAINIRKNIRFYDKYTENTEDAISWLNSSEITANSILEQLTRVSELAIQGASDVSGKEVRKALGNEIDQLLEQLVASSNTQVNGRYIFGGFETLTQPYTVNNSVENQTFAFTTGIGDTVDLTPPAKIVPGTITVRDGVGTIYNEGSDFSIDYDNGTITSLTLPTGNYSIDYGTQIFDVLINPTGIDGAINRRIAEKEDIRINITGNELFNFSSNTTFDVLITLRDALYVNDSSAIQNSLSDINTAIAKLRAGLETIGARLQRLDEHLIYLAELQTTKKAELSKYEDVDMSKEIIDLQKNEVALQAALQAGSRVMQLSILRFLG